MNLNSRDKLILVVVLVIIIWVAGIVTFIKPGIDDVKSAQNTLDAKEVELAEKHEIIEKDKTLPQDIRAAYDKANETGSIFYTRMDNQYDAASTVQDLFDVNGDGNKDIQNQNLTVSAMGVGAISKYVYTMPRTYSNLDNIISTYDPIVTEESETSTSSTLSTYTFSFNYIASKADIIQYVENLAQKDPKSLVLQSFAIGDIGDNQDNTEWNGSLSLTMYMIPTLKDPDIVQQEIEEGGETVNALEDIAE